MIRLDLNQSNENLINSHFQELCCDNFQQSRFKGGQSVADLALSSLDITGYAKRRNNVYPIEKRGSSNLSPYIRHGLLSLRDVWDRVEEFKYEDKSKFRDELLWQEFSRHLYAIIGEKSKNYLNFKVKSNARKNKNLNEMNCIKTIEDELEGTGYMVNQTRMWYASHFSLRESVDWSVHEDKMFKHLIDGSRAANRLGWHWVMGSQTGKPYGFSKFQVNKRASMLCNDCNLKFNCPIENWPENVETSPKNLDMEFDINNKFGPTEVISLSDSDPTHVWLTAESLGDNDPALDQLNGLPVIFIFDKILLKHLQISTKRISFLIDTLKEINQKKELEVILGNPFDVLKDIKFASTFAPVPKYRKITNSCPPTLEFPANRLVEPIDFYPKSFSSWRNKIKL